MPTKDLNSTSVTLRKLARFVFRHSLSNKWLIIQVVVLLGLSRLAINTLPFRQLERFLGQRRQESADHENALYLGYAHRIARAIRSISPYTPWTSNCLPQAMAAKTLLRWRGIPSTLYMGAAFEKDAAVSSGASALAGHAWLRCGPIYVTGGDGSKKYGAIVAFGN